MVTDFRLHSFPSESLSDRRVLSRKSLLQILLEPATTPLSVHRARDWCCWLIVHSHRTSGLISDHRPPSWSSHAKWSSSREITDYTSLSVIIAFDINRNERGMTRGRRRGKKQMRWVRTIGCGHLTSLPSFISGITWFALFFFLETEQNCRGSHSFDNCF